MMPSLSLKTYGQTDSRIIRILIPVIIENGLMTLSGMVLTGYIGRLPVTDINAYGLCTRIYSIYGALIRGMAAAVLVLLAKELMKRRRHLVNHLIQECYMEILFVSVLLSVLILICSGWILSFMSRDPVLLSGGKRLLLQTVWFYPLFALIRLNASAFQAKGNTGTPMKIAVAGNIVSIIFGYIWIFGIDSFHGYGISGAAMAQNLSLCVMFLLGTFLLYGKGGEYEGAFENWKMQDFSGSSKLIRMGIPAALEDSFWQFAAVMISRIILGYGQEYYASYQLGLQAEGFCDTMSAGFMTASLSLASGSSEEQNGVYLKRLRFFCRIVIMITMLFLLTLSSKVLWLLTDKPELIRIASRYLLVMVFSQYPTHMQKISNGFIKASGRAGTTMTVNLVGLWLIRVPLVYLLGSVLNADIMMIWWAFNADLWFRFILLEIILRRQRSAAAQQMR
jgi:putative MATE family efflux protein